MFKKVITLGIITAVLLTGVDKVSAQEGQDTPEQVREDDQQVRPRRGARARRFRAEEKDRDEQGKGARTEGKARAMRKERREKAAQKDFPADKSGREFQQSRPRRSRPAEKQLLDRGRQDLRGTGMAGWIRWCRRQGVCPCCQGSIRPLYQDYPGRGMGRGGPGLGGRGMGARGQGFRGRRMYEWDPGFQGRYGMRGRGPGFEQRGIGRWGRGFRGRGMRGGRGPCMYGAADARPFGANPPRQDFQRPVPPMRGRGMGRQQDRRQLREPPIRRRDTERPDMPEPQGPPAWRRGMGRPDMPEMDEPPMRGRGRGMVQPDSNMPWPERPMQRRGMGRGFPERERPENGPDSN